MSHINLDTDEIALKARRILDDARMYLTHPDPTVAHERAFENAVIVYNVAELVLGVLDRRDINEYDRFKSFAKEARDIINNFWSRFKVLPRASASPESTPVAPANGHVKHVGPDLLRSAATVKAPAMPTVAPVEAGKYSRLTDEQKQEIYTFLKSRSGPIAFEDIALLMSTYEISRSTVDRYIARAGKVALNRRGR